MCVGGGGGGGGGGRGEVLLKLIASFVVFVRSVSFPCFFFICVISPLGEYIDGCIWMGGGGGEKLMQEGWVGGGAVVMSCLYSAVSLPLVRE